MRDKFMPEPYFAAEKYQQEYKELLELKRFISTHLHEIADAARNAVCVSILRSMCQHVSRQWWHTNVLQCRPSLESSLGCF